MLFYARREKIGDVMMIVYEEICIVAVSIK